MKREDLKPRTFLKQKFSMGSDWEKENDVLVFINFNKYNDICRCLNASGRIVRLTFEFLLDHFQIIEEDD